jgi:ribonuclease-3
MNLLKRTVDWVSHRFLRAGTRAGVHNVFEELQDRLAYHFRDQSLLSLALTHKSHTDPDDRKGLRSNERLEFLGDAVLDCLVTENIFLRYPDYSEGQLSKIKSLVVSRKIIGEIARSVDLGLYIITGQSEKKANGRARPSIMSNAFEAILGAVYLDGGIGEARRLLERFLYDQIEDFINDTENVNYKSQILELAQGDGFGIPTYPLIAAEGPDHAKKFRVAIEVAGVRLGEGEGLNKKVAQQNAAFNALRIYSKEMIQSRLKGE